MPVDSANQLLYAHQAIKMLLKDFDQWPAYKKGIIDKEGNRIIPHWSSLKQSEYTDDYNIFVRFMAIVKKLLIYVPTQRGINFNQRMVMKNLREAVENISNHDASVEYMIKLQEILEQLDYIETDQDLTEGLTESIFSSGKRIQTMSMLEEYLERIEESTVAGAGPIGIAGVNDAAEDPALNTIVPNKKRKKKKEEDDLEDVSSKEEKKNKKEKSFRRIIDKL